MTDKGANHKYAYRIALGSLYLAEALTKLEKKEERKQKKQKCVDRKAKMLRESFPEYTNNIKTIIPEQILKKEWAWGKGTNFLVDLIFSSPFAPSELKYKDKDFMIALYGLAKHLCLSDSHIKRIMISKKSAMKAHRHIPWKRVAIYGLVGTLVMGAGGWVFAPAIGTALGTAAGLSGAAATSHGLAVLGGGSLAIGGYGMAGGMWLITGAGALAGISPASVKFLIELGSARAKLEIIKLQVSYKEIILDNQKETKQSLKIEESLREKEKEIELKIEEELQYNEKASVRIKDMEAVRDALKDCIKWIGKEKSVVIRGAV